jgi:hypothetical protein
MRTALTHARDWSCFIAAVAFVLYLTVLPQRPAERFRATGGTVTASLQDTDRSTINTSYSVAAGTSLPGAAR